MNQFSSASADRAPAGSNLLGNAVKRAVDEAVAAEVSKGFVETRSATVSSSLGFVESSIHALSTADTSLTLPDVLPLHSVAWPEPLKAMWETFSANVISGVFTSLARAWIVVDNKLLLWNYATGRDFTVFDEIPELIVAVGEPVAPLPDIFQPHITYVLPIATPEAVYLVGVCVVGSSSVRASELKIVNVGFAVRAPCLVVKIVGSETSGRFFAAGSDGSVYEIEYAKLSTLYRPQMRLVNYSAPFGAVPVLNAVGKMISTIKQTWFAPSPALRDMAYHELRQVLFTLDVNSTISLWKVLSSGLQFQASLKHTGSSSPHPTFTHNANRAPVSQPSPLVKIFAVHSSDDYVLAAIAENGEQYRYNCREQGWGMLAVDLAVRERLPSFFTSSTREVGACFMTEGTLICSHAESGDDKAADVISIVSTPKVPLPPHQNLRAVVTNIEPSTSRIVRVDAIGEVRPAGRVRCPNELYAQVCGPPEQFILTHRHGVADYFRLRPVDTLHAILAVSEPQYREGLIQRLSSMYTPVDYCCMLIQIASAGTVTNGLQMSGCASDYVTRYTTGYVDLQRAGNAMGTPGRLDNIPTGPTGAAGSVGGGRVPPSAAPSVNGYQAERLGLLLMSPPSGMVQRLACDILSRAVVPAWQENPASGSRQVVVQMSPFATATVAFLARALFPLWNATLSDLSFDTAGAVETLVTGLVRLLGTFKNDLWSDQVYQPSFGFSWDKCKVTLTLPMTATLPSGGVTGGGVSGYDLRMLQSSLLNAVNVMATNTLQVFRFLKSTAHIPLPPEEASTTLSQVVCSRENAARLARHVALTLMAPTMPLEDLGGGRGVHQSEKLRFLTWMQRECPYFFSTLDINEFQARAELDQMSELLTGDLDTTVSGMMVEFEARVSQSAAAMWTSGTLQSICHQLVAMKKEAVAVHLLLRAATQIDPTSVALEMYVDEQRGLPHNHASHALSASAVSAYREKLSILNTVVSILEQAWNSHRSAVDSLVGGPLVSGSIWEVEPEDEMAHCYLFDWLCGPREDPAVSAMLRETLVAAKSPFVEGYLKRNASTLGEQLASFLRRTRKSPEQAIEVYLAMAQGVLGGVPSSERLNYRLRCLTEAVDCALESRSALLNQVKQKRLLAETQLRLERVIRDFLSSGDPQLGNFVEDGQRRVTERQLATEQLELVETSLLNERQLLEVARMFSLYGGAELQLEVMQVMNVMDSMLYAECIERAFQRRNATTEDVARKLLTTHRDTVVFPISFVVRELEARAFKKWPHGTAFTVDLLHSCSIEPTVVFAAFLEIVEKRSIVGKTCRAFDEANVSDAYMVHSLAVALQRMVFAPHHGAAHMQFIIKAASTVYDALSRVGPPPLSDISEKQAIAAAERIAQKCTAMLRRMGSRLGY